MSATGQGVEGRGEEQHCAAAERTARASTPEPGVAHDHVRAEATSAVSVRTRARPRWTGRCGHGGRGGGVASGRGGGGRARRREAGEPASRRRSEPAPAPAAPPAAQQARLQDSGAGRPAGYRGTNRPINSGETREEEEMQGRRQLKSTNRSYTKKTAGTGETQELQACRPCWNEAHVHSAWRLQEAGGGGGGRRCVSPWRSNQAGRASNRSGEVHQLFRTRDRE